MVDGRDDWGISRRKGDGIPVSLVVYPGAYHAFDVPALATPVQYFGHHLEFSQSATDRSVDALRDFLYATVGKAERTKEPTR